MALEKQPGGPQLLTGALRTLHTCIERGYGEKMPDIGASPSKTDGRLLPSLPEGSPGSYKERSEFLLQIKMQERSVLAPRAWEVRNANMIT